MFSGPPYLSAPWSMALWARCFVRCIARLHAYYAQAPRLWLFLFKSHQDGVGCGALLPPGAGRA
eukprot:3469916-Lingulodinium_polyedra.AAC.1